MWVTTLLAGREIGLFHTVYGRQEPWEDSPPGWPQGCGDYTRVNGRPIAQWPRIEAGRSDDLTGSAALYTQKGRDTRAE